MTTDVTDGTPAQTTRNDEAAEALVAAAIRASRGVYREPMWDDWARQWLEEGKRSGAAAMWAAKATREDGLAWAEAQTVTMVAEPGRAHPGTALRLAAAEAAGLAAEAAALLRNGPRGPGQEGADRTAELANAASRAERAIACAERAKQIGLLLAGEGNEGNASGEAGRP